MSGRFIERAFRGAAHAVKVGTSVIVVAMLGWTTQAFAGPRSATLYFIPWDIDTRVDLSADRVRQVREVQVGIRSARTAEALLGLLEGPADPLLPPSSIADLRLVADVTMDDGSVVTFVASRFGVLDPRTGSVRKVDEAFRRDLATTVFSGSMP